MVKVLLILLGEWRYMGEVLYEKLSYLLSILPDLVRNFNFFFKQLIKGLLSLRIVVERVKGERRFKLRLGLNLWNRIVLYLDKRDKKKYKEWYRKEVLKREKRLEELEDWAKKRNEWLENKISGKTKRIRAFLLKLEKSIRGKLVKWREKMENKLNKKMVSFYEWLIEKVLEIEAELKKINPQLLILEELRKERVKGWKGGIKKVGNKVKKFLINQIQTPKLPPKVRVIIAEEIIKPMVEKKVNKWINRVESFREMRVLRELKTVKRWEQKLFYYKERFEHEREDYQLGRIQIWIPKIRLYGEKIPVLELKRNFFYEYYVKKKKKEYESWVLSVKKERDEVFHIELKGFYFDFSLGLKFKLKYRLDEKMWYKLESIEKRINETKQVTFFFRMVNEIYQLFLTIVMSDPFVYAWNVFFLVTGVYLLCIIAPFLFFFEWIRVKKK